MGNLESKMLYVFKLVRHEVDVFLSFSWRDWSATIIPGSLFSFRAMRDSHLDLASMLSSYLFLLSWLTLYAYSFDLVNQITGLEEDRIDKPDRPIPSGKVTLTGAKIRSAVALSLYMALAMVRPTLLPETLCWVATTIFLCFTKAGNHWFGKSCVAMTTGTWALLSGPWKAVTPATPQSERYTLALAVWAGLMTHIQDLRDVKGDAAVGRKTLPLAFGEDQSRRAITFVFLPAGLWVLWLGGIVQIAPTTVMLMHAYVGWRVMQTRGAQYDHKTYMFYTYTFCVMLLLIACRSVEED